MGKKYFGEKLIYLANLRLNNDALGNLLSGSVGENH